MLDKIPKSFLLGLSVASIICVIGLLIHLSVISGGAEDPHYGHGEAMNEKLQSEFNPNFAVPAGRNSHLGIYKRAAVATDAEPCAQIGQ